MAAARLILLAAATGLAEAGKSGFVPACIARECSAEAKALAGDAYTHALGKCASDNLGPCAPKAWECLGDPACRSVVSCAPSVLDTCRADIWKMMTDPVERERLMCIANCNKAGKTDPICVLKCGKDAVACLTDPTCRHAAECLPQVLRNCTADGFKCVFGKSDVCRENLKCLGHGLGECADPAVNMLTDSRIADFVSCAGSKCPQPEGIGISAAPVAKTMDVSALLGKMSMNATGVASQLLCVAEKCGSRVVQLLEGQNVKDLRHCADKAGVTQLCSSVWKCLGDRPCAGALHCWGEPLRRCKDSAWHLLTDAETRQGLTKNVECLQQCRVKHAGDFTSGAFCVLDECSEDLLKCRANSDCWDAVQCLPHAADSCAMGTLDAYTHQPLFQDSVKCLGRSLESCGRTAVSLLQDPDVAQAVSCAAQCTHQPGEGMELMV